MQEAGAAIRLSFCPTTMDLAEKLKNGGVGIFPTDTLYGLVGSALNPQVLERIYKLRKRNPDKLFIILISSMDDLKIFGIRLNKFTKDFLKKNWPSPVSVILPCPDPKFKYLHRGTNTLAFRIPKDEKLRKLLAKSGPLVAPSANFEGGKPAQTLEEAKKYFGDQVDFYVDGGKLSGQPSTLVSIKNGKVDIIRKGKYSLLRIDAGLPAEVTK